MEPRVGINLSYEDTVTLKDIVTASADTYRESNDMNDPSKLAEWARLDRIKADIALSIAYADARRER
jgi:hypothetical protein